MTDDQLVGWSAVSHQLSYLDGQTKTQPNIKFITLDLYMDQPMNQQTDRQWTEGLRDRFSGLLFFWGGGGDY